MVVVRRRPALAGARKAAGHMQESLAAAALRDGPQRGEGLLGGAPLVDHDDADGLVDDRSGDSAIRR
ncbi:MAG: hypothetical protein WAK86_06335 [Pseudonocardiaceae bacterium]